MNHRWILAATGVVVLATGIWLLAGNEDDGGQERGPAAGQAAHVNVVTAEYELMHDRVNAVGSTRAHKAVEITSEVDARIQALHFDEGEPVNEGDLLVALDDRRARAELESAAARLDDAEAKHRRAQRLRADGNISAAEADERQAELRGARAEKARARIALDNHRIHAPFDGVVGLREKSAGAWLRAGDTVTTLDSISPMELHFAIPERYLGPIEKGRSIQARNKAWPDHVFHAEITRLGSRVDPQSRNLRMIALIDNEEARLRPGQFMTLSLTLEERRSLVIPEEALLTEGRQQYVFVAENGEARHRAIERGQRERGRVEIRSGLSQGDQVIINGQDRLRDGQAVEVGEDAEALVPRDREGA